MGVGDGVIGVEGGWFSCFFWGGGGEGALG